MVSTENSRSLPIDRLMQMEHWELGPVFVRRGPYEYPCTFSVSDLGVEASFEDAEGFPA